MTSSAQPGRMDEEPLAARGVLTLVKALLLFESVLYSAITPLLPHYARALGASKPAIGVLAAPRLSQMIGRPSAGSGRRRWPARGHPQRQSLRYRPAPRSCQSRS